jgi:acetolactate synthase-1/2/3 large subunit
MGLGSVPRDHKLSLGLSGMHGLKPANHAVYEADVILAVGSRFGDRLTGNRAKYTKDKHFIHIDIDPAEIDKNVMSAIGLAGEISVILEELSKYIEKSDTAEWLAEIGKLQAEFAPNYDASYLNMPWAMNYIAKKTENIACSFVTDVGQHQMWAAQHLIMKEPRSWITSGGLGCMGFGLPAAMGAALSANRKIIHIAGDGGIKMTGNEYYTISRLNLPVISIIVDNSSLGMIRQLQTVFYKKRYIACELPEMDFVKYAESFGIHAAACQTADEFAAAFDKAMQSDRPEVIVMKIERDFVRPMTKAGAEINEFVDL